MADPLTVFQGEPSPTPLLANYTAAIAEAVKDAHLRLLPASALNTTLQLNQRDTCVHRPPRDRPAHAGRSRN